MAGKGDLFNFLWMIKFRFINWIWDITSQVTGSHYGSDTVNIKQTALDVHWKVCSFQILRFVHICRRCFSQNRCYLKFAAVFSFCGVCLQPYIFFCLFVWFLLGLFFKKFVRRRNTVTNFAPSHTFVVACSALLRSGQQASRLWWE